MYISIDEGLREKIIENRKNVCGGRIGFGHYNAGERGLVVGIPMGVLIGIFLLSPQIGFKIKMYDEHFWPAFISLIVAAVLLAKAVEMYFRSHGLKKFLESGDLTVEMGTVILPMIKNKPAYAILENDYKVPIPHYLNIMYINPTKPRMLASGTRVYILKTSNSIAIIPISDISGAPSETLYTYDSDTFNIENMECIYHPNVFNINSTERELTPEQKKIEFRNARKRTVFPRLMKALVIGLWTFGISFFCLLIFYRELSMSIILCIVLSFVLMIIATSIGYVIYTLKLQNSISKSDYVKTAFVEFPRTASWTGSSVLYTAEYTGGGLGRYSYDIKSAARNFHYFETVEIFYKKEIDGIKTLC